jgi:anaphase-promoting complex subunit 10
MSDDSPSSPLPYGSATSTNVSFTGLDTRSLHAYLRIGGASNSFEEESDSIHTGSLMDSSHRHVPIPSSLRELGDEAVWSLTSAKQGNGVECMRDDDSSSFWQSDGTLPHVVTIQFHRKTRVSCICVYLDHKQDESYTPGKICIRVGNGTAGGAAASAMMAELGGGGASDAMEVKELDRFELVDPMGWMVCHIKQPSSDESGLDGDASAVSSSIRCHFVQFVVLGSFQNGRDTRIRQMKIFGPRNWANTGALHELSNMTSVEFRQHAQIR